MKTIRLELESFKILKKRERWQIYFIVYTSYPDNPDKTIVKFVPGGYNIRLKPAADNQYFFKPTGTGTDGLRIFQSTLSEENYVDVRLVMMQSRKNLRTLVAKMNELKKALDIKDVIPVRLSHFQWYLIDKGFDMIAGLIQNIKDRNMGFVSMDEEFEEEFEVNPNQKRTNRLSTGEAEITWIWELK